jgi:hypothetical protein
MEAQQNFIIEASRQTSIENNANLQQTNSAWTNRIEPTLLKKGDYVSVNTAIVNQKGASGANNIEFSDQYNDSTSNLQQNFTLLNVGFYLNNNNVNSIPLPYKYLHAQANRTDPTKVANNGGRKRIEYDTDLFKEVDGNQVINNTYGVARWYQIFANDYSSLSNHTADSLASFSAMNPNIKIDGKRYAKVGNSYVGWNRPDGGGKVSTSVELLTQNIPLHIEKGFKDASSVGQTLTRTLQSTQDPYSSTEVFAIPKSTLATLDANPTAQTQTNPRFNGYCMKTIGANLQPYKDGILSNTEGALGNSALYNNLCVEEPYVWEYGSRLLSNVETMRLLNNPNINDDYIGLNPHVGIDYPVLLWSTWIGSNPFDQGAIQSTSDYDFYSPHYTEAVDAGVGETGENVVSWTGFSGVMIDFNDDYGHLAEDIDDDRGVMLFKDTPTTYKFYVPQTNAFVPTDPDDGTKKLAFQAFIDNDSPSFDRILGYSPKNQIESSNWSVLGENIIEWDFTQFLFDLGTNNPNMFQQITDASGVVADAFSINNSPVVGGTTRTNYMYNFVPYANRIIQGKKYRVSFKLTQVIGADYNTFQFGLVDRTSSFGFPGIAATADGVYTQEFIATADSSSVANFMFYFKNNISQYPAFLWKVEDFVIYEYDIEVGDKYVLSDIFTPTTSTTSKMYKMKIDDGQLRSEKVNLVNSTIFGGVFNNQYTAYAKLRAYKSGSDIIAFDGINANDYDDAVIMLYQDPQLANDYIIYNQYGSKVWRMAEITKYTGNNIQSGDTIGTIVGGNETSLKNPFRSGQQYYDFSVGNVWENRQRPIYDYASGNDWTNATPGGYSSLRFFPTPGNAGGNIGYYDGYWANPLNLPQRVYYRYNPQGDTTAISGTAYYPPSDPAPYWERQWSFDINAGANGTFTQVYTNGASATYTPSGALTTTYTPINITSFITDPLPTITAGAPINQTYSYFASFQAHVSAGPGLITFYLAMNTTQTDTDLQGKQGTLIWDDGGVWSAETWVWDGATTLNLINAYGGMVINASATPTLTNILQYETKQDVVIGGITYAFPSNGKQYGYSTLTLMGETTLVTDLHNPLPVSSQAIDELFLGIDMTAFTHNGFNNGLVYETEGENDTNNAICSWSLTFNQTQAILIFSETITGATLLTLEEDLSNITRYGWVLIKCNKYNTGIALGDPTQTLTIQSGSGTETGNYYSGSRNYALTGGNGRFIVDGVHNFPHDTGTSAFLEDQNLERFNSNMPKSTLLMTNIKLTLANLEIVKDYFRYTEIYQGTIESSRKKISEDIDHFYTRLDLGRTNDDKLQVDRTEAPYVPPPYDQADKAIASVPLFNFTMRNYGAMGVDDSDADQFTDYNGTTRKGSNKNDGCITPRMLTESGVEQRPKIFTRWKDGYEDRVIAENRLTDRMKTGTYWETQSRLYGKSITTDNFKTQYADEYNYCVNNNVGIVPYLAKDWTDSSYVLCIGFETFEDIGLTNNTTLKIQDGTFVGFSPSFLDHNYIMPMNLDMPFVAGEFNYGGSPNTLPLGYSPSIRKQDNMNHINIGSAPTITYNPELNRFQWTYLHTPFRFNEVTGASDDLEEEVGFLNSSKLMRMEQSIGENNLVSGGEPERTDPSGNVTPAVPPTSVHMGLADAQCGIFIHDLYGQTPSDTFIRDKNDGTLLVSTNYDNTLFFTLGFSYFDLKPIRFSGTSFNNRFNSNTYNVISGDFKKLGTSPFTTNSAIDVGDQIKTNIFTDGYLTRTYSTDSPYSELPDPNSSEGANGFAQGGTPAFYLGYNNLLATSIKTSSGSMTSRSVIVNLTSPFYRIYCNLPLDTLTYLASGSLSCAGYMTKNYQSQSFIYSFASDYGGFLTRDVLITDLRTEIRDPRGLLVNSIDSNSAVFYKVTRQIALESGLTQEQEKEQAEQLLARQQQEAEEQADIRTTSMEVIKYFKTLFSGMKNTDAMTASLGEPSGVDEVYQTLQQDTPYQFTDAELKDIYDRHPELKESAEKLPEILEKERQLRDARRGVETKEEDRAFIPTLNFHLLSGMTEEEQEVPYDARQHRLFVKMGEVMEDALRNAQTLSPRGIMELQELDKNIRQLQLGGSVLDKLIKGLDKVSNRKDLRKLVEKTIGNNPNEYTTIAERKKRATQILKVLHKAQDLSILEFPSLMGKNPVRRRGKKVYVDTDPTTRERSLLTEKQRERAERNRMNMEDKERRGRPSAQKLRLREQMGKYDSPARQKGRAVLKEKAKGTPIEEIRKRLFGRGGSKEGGASK